MEKAKGELAALHRDGEEAAQIKKEHDELCQSELVLRTERDIA